MAELRVIIAEDDPGMRLVLRRLIEKEEGFVLAGEAENGPDAVRLAREVSPDVAFLDIEMPGADGLTTARTLCAENEKLAIIFATGHDEFMSEAFELYAFDYLLKPFDLARVRRTLGRLRSALAERREERPAAPPRVTHDRLTLRSRDGITFVDPSTILFIVRVDRESILTTTEGELSTSEGLGDLAERLDPGLFLRTHRSYIVNTRMIVRAVPYGRWTYTLYLKGTDKTALATSDKLAEITE